MKKEIKRLSAEGMIVALEYLALVGLKAQDEEKPAAPKKPISKAKAQALAKKGKGQLAGIEETPEGLEITNFAGVVFAMTHPWVEIHQPAASQCDNPPKMHEVEYRGMLEMAKAVLEHRAKED